ncbi:1,4-alpha-glucan branching protein [Streptomyces lunaelactis]|uniref:1,4-alpha-glucan branching protein n=1 Tax=Streptomyces lunaelactis TaxID=1535768 RepID=A0A2R4TCR9_9ACTN|nr:1,4-alpha-glucan branching protein [Streptomyces lunaelactis]AVZ76916.1 1,4-alpha-glucan branching protein [Streptomyces lunaelactis]NUK86330.1 1,4-alpha-glucan branching protein [Streptomyces lunaelactis]
MAVVHNTTLTPSKVELLARWLPRQSWYVGSGREPELTKVGGFRIDDPEGEVGIEFMVVTDGSGDQPMTYQVPLGYRGSPLAGADHALVGTTEHGVLGRRWIYDGTHDPVLVAQLFALIQGEAQPQDQNASDTLDATVTSFFAETGPTAVIRAMSVTNGSNGTNLLVRTTAATAGSGTRQDRELSIRVNRVLRAGQGDSAAHARQPVGYVAAGWLQPDGSRARGLFAVVHDATPEPKAGDPE